MSRLLRTTQLLRRAGAGAHPLYTSPPTITSSCSSTPTPAQTPPSSSTRPFTTLPSLQKKQPPLPPRPKPPPETEIDESFLKGSGPGGQKINKTNSAVQLKHLPTGLVIKCQATRSRTENRKIARQLLADKLDDLSRGTDSRSSVVGEVRRKKRASAAKKKRRKYRKLGEGEEGQEAVNEEEEGEEGEEDDAAFEDEIDQAQESRETVDPRHDRKPSKLYQEKT